MGILDWLEIIESLSDFEKDNLSMFCQIKDIKKWEKLFIEWDEATAMYILKEWQFEIYKETSWNKIVLWLVDAEEILWEMALFWDNSKRMATAIATTDCKLITILSFSIKELTDKYPSLLSKIKSIIDDRVIDNKILESTM